MSHCAPVSDLELADIQADIAELMPSTGIAYSPVNTPDGQGGMVQTWQAAGTTSCRLDLVAKTKEMEAAGDLLPYTRWVLSVPVDFAMTTKQRFEVDGVTYNVVSLADQGSWMVAKRAILERLP